MTTEGGGWTVFQRRMDGSVDFYLGWEDYRVGFGNLSGEFWLGNDNLHRLTANADMMLRVDLEDYDGVRKYAEYMTFSVADADDNYRLTIDGYQGTAGDSMVSPGVQSAKYVRTGNLTFSGFQMSISPPLGLHCKSNSHPWGPQTFIVS